MCRFCDIANKKVPCKIIYEDKDVIAFLDRFPVNPGHILVIPKKHYPTIWDLEKDLYDSLFDKVNTIGHIVKAEMKPEKVGLLVSGFDIDHCHIHIIPMNSRDDVATKRVFDNYWKESGEENLDIIKERIISHLQ